METAGLGGIAIRRMAAGDAGLVAHVAPEVFDAEIVSERLDAYLADSQNLMILAFEGPLVVGQARGVVHRHPDLATELYIDNLGVAPSHRRRGIGRALIAALMEWGRERGCEECWVGTEPDNLPARRLYQDFDGDPAETFVLYFYDL